MKTNRLVTLRLEGSIAVLSLNRPARHNALVPELLSRLLQVLQQKDCLAATVVLLRAEGPSFSTGGDISGFQNHRETIGKYAHELVGLLNQVNNRSQNSFGHVVFSLAWRGVAVVCALHFIIRQPWSVALD